MLKHGGLRYCESLALPTFDLPTTSCAWKTAFCARYCYNNKLRGFYNNGKDWGVDLERMRLWRASSADELAFQWAKHPAVKKTKRIRMVSRGELFTTLGDVLKMWEIAHLLPDVKFWIPTRAWRNEERRIDIQVWLLPLPNVFVMASLDPTNTKEEIRMLKKRKWATMFFGDDKSSPNNGTKCAKTWQKKHGHCAQCGVCFSKQSQVWLKKH